MKCPYYEIKRTVNHHIAVPDNFRKVEVADFRELFFTVSPMVYISYVDRKWPVEEKEAVFFVKKQIDDSTLCVTREESVDSNLEMKLKGEYGRSVLDVKGHRECYASESTGRTMYMNLLDVDRLGKLTEIGTKQLIPEGLT